MVCHSHHVINSKEILSKLVNFAKVNFIHNKLNLKINIKKQIYLINKSPKVK